MKFKSLMLLAMAMGCGLVAMLGVQQILSGGTGAAPVDTVKVLVAKQEINPGFKLDETLTEFQEWAKDTVPPGAITEPAQYEDRALKTRAFPGEIILQAKLGERGVFGASAAIVQGMRVVSVPVNNTSAISGMIRPGDRVDILVTYKTQKPGANTISRTRTVLEYIEVFAVDRIRDAEGGDNKAAAAKAENISVLVTPVQSLVLMQYINKGLVQMSLRHPDDKKVVNAGTVDDSVSDDVDAPTEVALSEGGPSESEPAEPEQEVPPEPKSENFSTFLNAETATAAPATDPAKKVWEIKIYEGETFRVEKIELPDEQPGIETQPSQPATPKPGLEKPVASSA